MLIRHQENGGATMASLSRAGVVAAAFCLTVTAGTVTAATAMAAQPARHAAASGHHAALAPARGVRFGYANGTHIVVNPTCLATAQGSTKHDGLLPTSVANDCSSYVDLTRPHIVGCLSVKPGGSLKLSPVFNAWAMAVSPVCPGARP